MNVELRDVLNVLSIYNISSAVTDFRFFINGFNAQTADMKFIIKVEFSDRNALVVKLIRQDRYPHHVIEEQSRFSEQLRSRGTLTPTRYKSGCDYCIIYPFHGCTLDVTVEEYLGEEIKAIDHNIAFDIGTLMGKNHCIAKNDNLHINHNTLFNIVGYNEVIGYDRFIELGNVALRHNLLFHEICSIYEKKLNQLNAVWGDLPKYATQGDYSINNLTYVGDELGLFDYNNAGDETLISDMILEGLLIAYEMDLANGLLASDRPGLFQSFVNGYIEQRPLSEKEKSAFNHIYTISKGLWFTRIQYNDDSLENLIKNREDNKVSELITELYQDITDTFTL